IERVQNAYELITGKSGKPFLGVVIEYAEHANESRTLELVPKRVEGRTPNVSEGRLTVGLLGAGTFATGILLPALKTSSHTKLVGVCTATGPHARHAAQKFGFDYCTTDEARILADREINTVVVATRHHLHAEQVLAAVREGKHVFCEKPLCLSEQQLGSIVRAYRRSSSVKDTALIVGFNRRFAPMTTQMKAFFASITEPLALHYRVNAGFLPADHWINDPEQGGGRILGEVCHFVDLLSFLTDSRITQVEARPLGNAGRYSGDNLIISLRFSNGSEGTITYLANGDRAYSKERLEIFGGGMTAVLDDFRRLDLVRNGRTRTIRSRWRQNKGHNAEWAAFVDSINHHKAAVPFEDIVASTLATLRINESAKIGKPLAVDAAAFIQSALQGPNSNE
ncbi:MAG TPA: Gfo/Idh/MocA family oxidoreductase, partial [Terriglobales bacterium]|nr:Gfo/Idh/MocA family oxidoreductase [Terriglobales bacterium]